MASFMVHITFPRILAKPLTTVLFILRYSPCNSVTPQHPGQDHPNQTTPRRRAELTSAKEPGFTTPFKAVRRKYILPRNTKATHPPSRNDGTAPDCPTVNRI